MNVELKKKKKGYLSAWTDVDLTDEPFTAKTTTVLRSAIVLRPVVSTVGEAGMARKLTDRRLAGFNKFPGPPLHWSRMEPLES